MAALRFGDDFSLLQHPSASTANFCGRGSELFVLHRLNVSCARLKGTQTAKANPAGQCVDVWRFGGLSDVSRGCGPRHVYCYTSNGRFQ